MPENSLLELETRVVEVLVHADCRDLCLERGVLALQPVHVAIVFLHELDEGVHAHPVDGRRQTSLYDLIRGNIDAAHAEGPQRALQTTLCKKDACTLGLL